jgi:hypothetical protein
MLITSSWLFFLQLNIIIIGFLIARMIQFFLNSDKPTLGHAFVFICLAKSSSII